MLGKGLASLIPSRGGTHLRSSDDELRRGKDGEDKKEEKQDENVKTPLIEEKQVYSVPLVERRDGETEKQKNRKTDDAELRTGEALLRPAEAGLRMGEAVFHIELDKIHPNPYQPRREFDEDALKELAHSIQEYGIIQPLVVSRLRTEKDSGADVEYQIIAGERRWRAAKLAGLPRVPVVVRKEEAPKGNLELALVENLQRSNLNPVETARAYSRLQDEFGLTQREVAQRVGKSREAVANTLRLLQLPSEIQDAVASGKIGESQARILLGISDLEQQRRAFQGLLEGKMSVRTLKEKVKDSKGGPDPEKSFFEKQLEEKIGAPVHISKLGDGGKVVIRFFSDEEMQGVLKRLLGEME